MHVLTGGIISSESERDGVVLTGVPREINAGSITTPMLLADGKDSPACEETSPTDISHAYVFVCRLGLIQR